MKHKTKKTLSWLLSLVLMLSLVPAFSMTAFADGDTTSYTLVIPSALNVANSGWNATDGISATGTLATGKKLTVTASSGDEFALVSGENKVGYKLAAASTDTEATTSWEFTSLSNEAATKPMGIIVEDYSSKPAGTYQDTVTFTASVSDAGTPVTAITLNYTAMTIVPDQTETLSLKTVTPDDATDKTVTWSSDNTDVATVNASTGLVTAKGAGTANITATTNDGSGVTATCAVTVVVPDLVITGTSPATIPAGKTAVLNGVNISNGSIICSGDATIILVGDNTVTGAANNAAIQINLMDAYSENYTLTITGTGSITAQGGDKAAGIGSGNCMESGKIIITGGTIIATGGNNAAGIGSGYCADAKNITIANTVTKVTATKGSGAEHSIGGGAIGGMFNGCSVTIDGTGYNGISTSPYTYQP